MNRKSQKINKTVVTSSPLKQKKSIFLLILEKVNAIGRTEEVGDLGAA